MELLSKYIETPVQGLYEPNSKDTGFETQLKQFEELNTVVKGEDTKKRDIQLHKLNKELLNKVFIFSDKLSTFDLIYYSLLHSWMNQLNDKDRFIFCNITRWFNFIQNQKSINSTGKPIIVINTNPPPVEVKKVDKKEGDKKEGEKKEGGEQPKKEQQPKRESKKPTTPAVVEPPKPEDVSRFEIRVGQIVECKRHESADALYVERIDLGEPTGPRQIVSGLVKFIPIEKMVNSRVLVLCNLKPSKLRGVESQGMVLCASDAEHTKVEFVNPPEGAKIGERVTFANYPGEFDKVLKKEIVDQVLDQLLSNQDKIATYKGDVFMTSAGPCFCETISNGIIK
eukprot:gene7991-9833_t